MSLIKLEFDSCIAPGRFLLCRALDPEAAGPVFDLLDDESTRPVEEASQLVSLARAFGWEEDEEEPDDPREYLKLCASEERVVKDPGFFAEDEETTVEIYFQDLTPQKQSEVLSALGIKDPKDANLDIDVVPLAILHLKEGS